MNELTGRLGSGGGVLGVLSPGGAGGTNDHGALINRDAPDQHPVGAITGLEGALGRIPPAVEPITNTELEELLK